MVGQGRKNVSRSPRYYNILARNFEWISTRGYLLGRSTRNDCHKFQATKVEASSDSLMGGAITNNCHYGGGKVPSLYLSTNAFVHPYGGRQFGIGNRLVEKTQSRLSKNSNVRPGLCSDNNHRL